MRPVREDRARAVWEVELDRLELEVIRTERLLKGLESVPVEPWEPPAVPGPLPADLAARAQDLLDRQERARRNLQGALSGAQRHLAYADRVAVATGRNAAGPVYLDIGA